MSVLFLHKGHQLVTKQIIQCTQKAENTVVRTSVHKDYDLLMFNSRESIWGVTVLTWCWSPLMTSAINLSRALCSFIQSACLRCHIFSASSLGNKKHKHQGPAWKRSFCTQFTRQRTKYLLDISLLPTIHNFSVYLCQSIKMAVPVYDIWQTRVITELPALFIYFKITSFIAKINKTVSLIWINSLFTGYNGSPVRIFPTTKGCPETPQTWQEHIL